MVDAFADELWLFALNGRFCGKQRGYRVSGILEDINACKTADENACKPAWLTQKSAFKTAVFRNCRVKIPVKVLR